MKKLQEIIVPPDLCYDDIRVQLHTGRFIRNYSSQDKKAGKYRSGMLTKIGDLEECEWYIYAEELIRRNGDEALFKRLVNWNRQNCAWLRNEKEAINYTLECFINGLHNNPEWVDYAAFWALQ